MPPLIASLALWLVALMVGCDWSPDSSAGVAHDDPLRQQDFIPSPDAGDGSDFLCSVRAQDCPADHKCVPWLDGGVWAGTRCVPAPSDGLAPGEPCTGDEACEHISDCGPGLTCIDGANVPACQGVGCCTPYCDTTAPACPDGLTCQPWPSDSTLPPGNENLGYV